MVNILLIEDNEMILRSIENLLHKEGFNVILARNGREACDYLDKEDFDAVVTDLMLPYTNGLEIIKQIKSDPSKKHVRIIVVSSKVNEESKLEAYRLGIDEYLPKPIMPVELVMRIKKLLYHKVMLGRAY